MTEEGVVQEGDFLPSLPPPPPRPQRKKFTTTEQGVVQEGDFPPFLPPSSSEENLHPLRKISADAHESY